MSPTFITGNGGFPPIEAGDIFYRYRTLQKCEKRWIHNWSMVINQLLFDNRLTSFMEWYDTDY